MKAGQRVRVSCAQRGAVTATLEEVLSPAELPTLSGTRISAAVVRTILEEWEADRVAFISYDYGLYGRVCFAALEIRGRWFDMKRQELTIEAIQ